MADIDVGKVPFKEAINYFESKLKIPSKYWDSMKGDTHAKAFTVAGATKADLLTDLHTAVNNVIKNGGTITDFRKQFDKTVAKHGWSYKGKRGWRTRVIYDTNLRTAHAAGKWQQIQRLKDRRPFLQYFTAGDARVRPEHRAWSGTVLPVDDDWWSTHYPPNGWGCRCGARSLSLRQIRKEGLDIANQAPPIEETERLNLRGANKETGEIPSYGLVPKGIDTGWNYNVGQAWLGPDIAFGEKIMAMPSPLRTAALNNAKDLAPHLEKVFSPWANKLLTRKKPLGEIKTVGYLSPRIVDELIRRNQIPTTAVITVTDKDIMHMVRDTKKGRSISIEQVKKLPNLIQQPSAVLWDKRNPALLYVFDAISDERSGKVVVRVNYKTKARAEDGERYSAQTNSLRSGGLVEARNLADTAFYDLVDGTL